MKLESKADIRPSSYSPQARMSDGRTFDVAAYYCADPECPCTVAELDFYEGGERAFMIMLDYAAWRVDSLKIYKSDGDYLKYANEFITDADDDLKERIRAARFPREDVLRTDVNLADFKISDMAYYFEIYDSPEYGQLIVRENERDYLVCDAYCPNPDCHCNDVVLPFQTLTDGKALEAPVLCLRLNFKTGKYEFESKSKDVTNEQADRMSQQLMALFGGETAGLRVLKERYSRVKKWGAEYLLPHLKDAKAREIPVPKARKVGRNEPCPCGSGKKYKHCCG